MNRVTSLYLDVVRFAAAVVVLLVHARHEQFTSGWLAAMRHFGNDAVMVFFVLSGFVIAYCVDTKEREVRDYALSRLARLYSVVVPALALTVLLDYSGAALNPDFYKPEVFKEPVLGVVTNLFFVNQLWFTSITPLSNNPFWSLGFEVWYYIIFGVITFYSGAKRLLLLFTAAAIAGPKILILFPVWLIGVWTYRFSKRKSLSAPVGAGLFFGSIAMYVLLRMVDLPLRLDWHTANIIGQDFYTKQLSECRNFLFSYITGALVAANFIGFDSMSKQLNFQKPPMESQIRWLAGDTFTLYLVHYTVMNFIAAASHHTPTSPASQIFLFAMTFVSVMLFSKVSEDQKNTWRRVFENIESRIRNALPSSTREAK